MLNSTQKFSFIFCLFLIIGTVQAVPRQEARHLLVRTGFGVSYQDLEHYSKLEYEQAVDQLLNQTNAKLSIAPPHWLFEPLNFDRKRMKNASEEEKKAFRKARKLKEFELKGWWLAEMVNTDSQLTEKMVLFWHNHFTSSLKKVKQPRELLELFTLGEGNYSEQDIKAAARAFTGWSIDRKTGEYKFRKGMHDFGEKEFMGQQGKLNGNDIIEIIFQQPEVANLLVTKLWKEFISEIPDELEIERLAYNFRANNFEMKPLMRELLLSQSFRNSTDYAGLIKSPVDYVVGTLRMLEIPIEDGKGAAFACANLGQNVFDPPNVKGWLGGKDWITSSSLLTRQQLLERMFRGNAADSAKKENKLDRRVKMQKMLSKGMQKVDLRPYLEKYSKKYSKQEVLEHMLADKPVDTEILSINKKKFDIDDLMSLMSDPVYQLK